ncbi:MAG: UbiA family prenyltransferase [Cyclobacteriaceae bacterium]
MKKSTLVHLRFPFSFFLLPVFLFASAIIGSFSLLEFVAVFFILHFLLYPASNGYNSFFDKDEGSIGGVRNPPKVTKELYYVAWGLDILAISLGLCFSWEFALMLFIYGMVSKAYSHPITRLKKRPILGWLSAGVFQGYFTFLMVVVAFSGLDSIWNQEIQWAALLSTLLLFGSYPMTQVYQHEEDAKRGDITISLILGVVGTFHFTAICFTISVALFVWFFCVYFSQGLAVGFVACLAPTLLFFSNWYLNVLEKLDQANYDNTMKLNIISSTCLNLFFVWMIVS